MHMYIFSFRLFSFTVYYKILNVIPSAASGSLFICFVCSSVFLV